MPQRDMARLSFSYIFALLLTLTMTAVLYISWADVSKSNCLLKFGSQFWAFPPTAESSTEPPGLTPIPILHKKDFKKLPQWDFDDQYRTDRHGHKTTQKCDGSLWRKIKSDPELRDKFLSNIRMYVYNGSITMSEWNRLSHFNNPFGFMDYSHKDVMKGLSLVQKPKYPLLSPKPGRDCISCAVVANGGVLWRSKKGQEIDCHNYVFRVNGAVIKGFEEDVGSRTDVYVHTAHSITSSEALFRKYNYTRAPHDEGIKYVLIPEGMRDFEWLYGLYKRERLTSGSYKGRRPWTQYSDQFNETNFYVLHMDFLRYVRNRFLKSPTLNARYWHIVRPTNGAFMMFLALQLCDRVDAYGFITEDHKKYSNYYFERGANTHVVFYANHNYNMERELWKRLHDLDIIHLYLGEPREDKTTQEAPKAPQAAPKAPQVAPKVPQAAPKAPQAAPKAPQVAPKAPQAAPKAPQAAPKVPQVAPKATKGPPSFTQHPQKATPPNTTQRPPKATQRPAKAAQRPAKAAQRPAKAAQRPPQATQRPPQATQRPPQATQRPPQATQRPPQATQRPPKATQRPPKATQRPPKATQRPPQATQRPPQATQRPPQATQRPPQATQRPPKATQRPPKATQRPPKATQRPPMATSTSHV